MHRFQRNNGPDIRDFAIRLGIWFISLAVGITMPRTGGPTDNQLGQEERRAFNSMVVSCQYGVKVLDTELA